MTIFRKLLFFSKVPKEECHTEYDTDCHRIPYEKCDTHYEKKCRTEYRYFKHRHAHEFPVKMLLLFFFQGGEALQDGEPLLLAAELPEGRAVPIMPTNKSFCGVWAQDSLIAGDDLQVQNVYTACGREKIKTYSSLTRYPARGFWEKIGSC